MALIFALGACLILTGLAVFQLALVLGAPLGKFAWGGQHTVLPPALRVGSVVSIILYGLFAMLLLEKAEYIHVIGNTSVVGVGAWVLTAYFFVGVFMNAISRSKPERAIMTPLALVLAMLCLGLAIS